jgi:hypothetical protein
MTIIISNFVNFMTEALVDSLGKNIGSILIVHINKTEDQLKDFRIRHPHKSVVLTSAPHCKIIDNLIKCDNIRQMDIVFFVDHDVIFKPSGFISYKEELTEQLYKYPNCFLAAQEYKIHSNMLCPYKYRTTPMFAVRPSHSEDLLFSECFFRQAIPNNGFWDTGQHMVHRRPDKLTTVPEWANYNCGRPLVPSMGDPFLHWTSIWMYQDHAMIPQLMEYYCDISKSDFAAMRKFKSLKKFTNLLHNFEKL